MNSFKAPKYSYNVTTVKKMGENFLQLKTMHVQRTPHTEESNTDKPLEIVVDPFPDDDGKAYIIKDGTKTFEKMERRQAQGEVVKLDESLIRSRRSVFEYAYSNEWDFFCTFTIDKSKYDRHNLNKYHTDFSHWIRNYFRRKYELNIQYICIPERHKDGAWHEHALISGITLEHLRQFTMDEKLPKYIRDKITKGESIYDCPAYRNKFGFCTFEPVRSSEACAKYITKYITKDLQSSVTDLNAKIYYVSRGLQKAEKIMIGHYDGNPIYDYENLYCKSATFAYSEEFMERVLTKIKPLER